MCVCFACVSVWIVCCVVSLPFLFPSFLLCVNCVHRFFLLLHLFTFNLFQHNFSVFLVLSFSFYFLSLSSCTYKMAEFYFSILFFLIKKHSSLFCFFLWVFLFIIFFYFPSTQRFRIFFSFSPKHNFSFYLCHRWNFFKLWNLYVLWIFINYTTKGKHWIY